MGRHIIMEEYMRSKANMQHAGPTDGLYDTAMRVNVNPARIVNENVVTRSINVDVAIMISDMPSEEIEKIRDLVEEELDSRKETSQECEMRDRPQPVRPVRRLLPSVPPQILRLPPTIDPRPQSPPLIHYGSAPSAYVQILRPPSTIDPRPQSPPLIHYGSAPSAHVQTQSSHIPFRNHQSDDVWEIPSAHGHHQSTASAHKQTHSSAASSGHHHQSAAPSAHGHRQSAPSADKQTYSSAVSSGHHHQSAAPSVHGHRQSTPSAYKHRQSTASARKQTYSSPISSGHHQSVPSAHERRQSVPSANKQIRSSSAIPSEHQQSASSSHGNISSSSHISSISSTHLSRKDIWTLRKEFEDKRKLKEIQKSETRKRVEMKKTEGHVTSSTSSSSLRKRYSPSTENKRILFIHKRSSSS
ncbi:serine/arginine repetitive matrix protein 1-like [Harpegnathos saltator]|uniref:serine/arginine repetitive matrix protein 1-like n=1 Tax=Harpegnathos saltator TaxID=610380 RepID=UPI000DBEF179|nr:serine/arginine repetitive matrix protein 1-like [Harpegnathos saltator]